MTVMITLYNPSIPYSAKLPKASGQSLLRSLLCHSLLVLFTASSYSQVSSGEQYMVYSNEDGKIISLQELVNQTNDVDVLFFGEIHTDDIGHWVQDTLYQLLINKHKKATLSLEMFETDVQLVLDEYLGGHITEAKMTGASRPWNNYDEHYRPLVERAKRSQQSIIAANAPRRYANMISRNGLNAVKKLPKASLKYLAPLPIYTEDQGYKKRFDEIMGSIHSSESKIFQAQCMWDATMAHRIYQRWRKHKKEFIYHLVGKFHTDYKQGTITQLRRCSKKIKIKNISCFSADNFDSPNWKEHKNVADYIILTKKSS